MSDVSDLIKQAEEVSTRTHLPYERRLIDTAVWFHKNKDRISKENVQARQDFMEKMLDIVLELFVMSLERQHEVEGRNRAPSLWLPRGLDAKGDMTRFG